VSRIELDFDEQTYHAMPGLSGSGVKKLLDCPADFKRPVNVTEAMRIGTAFHARVLGSTMEVEVSGKWATGSGAAAKTWALDCDERGVIPVIEAWIPKLDAMEAALKANTRAARLMYGLPGTNEASLFSEWDGVTVRGRADRIVDWPDGGIAVADLKTTADPARADYEKAIFERGYDAQVVMYERLACEAMGRRASQTPFIVAVGTAEPHRVVVYQLSDTDAEYASAMVDRAVALYEACTARNEWPDWDADALVVPRAPVWVERQRERTQDAATAWVDATTNTGMEATA